MGCKVTLKLLTERQDGPIGDDWRYKVEIKTFNEGLKGKELIKVAKHNLPDGHTQDVPGPPAPVTLPAGDGGNFMVRLKVDATEVDWLIHDRGSSSLDVPMKCPGPGELPLTEDVVVTVGVRESPGISGETSVFKLTMQLTAECD